MVSLLVDIGNTRLKWAEKKNHRLEIAEAVNSSHETIDFGTIWGKHELPSRVLVSSVRNPDFNRNLTQWMREKWDLSPDFVRSLASGFGVKSGYRDPNQLGVDRWLCLVAARALYRQAVCVVDVGTAITLDVLDHDGRHQGGLISPGLVLMQEALIHGTSQVVDQAQQSNELLGRDTASGIYLGTLNAAAGLVEKQCRELSNRMQSGLKLVLTGGGAVAVAERLAVEHELVADLVLQGLAVIEAAGRSK